jgi:stress-induced morphogen
MEKSSIEKTIETKIKEGIEGVSEFKLQDMSDGCGQKFFCVIIASEFEEVGLLDRQRKVNKILEAEIASIHAFELKTWTPE